MATTESALKKARDRSPSFPIITLETALRRAQEFYQEEKRGSAPFQVAAGHWHYSPSSSGALQTVSALKQYGLIAEEGGSGRDRKLKLTELALRIILDTRPESVERAQFMAQAARSPQIISEIYAKWPDGLPSEQNLNHYLVLERQFNEATAAKAVKIMKENELFTVERSNAMLSEHRQMETDSMNRAGSLANENAIMDAPVLSMRSGRQQQAPAGGGQADQTEVASFPVGKNQVVRLVTTKGLTEPAVVALIKQLQLGVDLGLYPEEEEQE